MVDVLAPIDLSPKFRASMNSGSLRNKANAPRVMINRIAFNFENSSGKLVQKIKTDDFCCRMAVKSMLNILEPIKK